MTRKLLVRRLFGSPLFILAGVPILWDGLGMVALGPRGRLFILLGTGLLALATYVYVVKLEAAMSMAPNPPRTWPVATGVATSSLLLALTPGDLFAITLGSLCIGLGVGMTASSGWLLWSDPRFGVGAAET